MSRVETFGVEGLQSCVIDRPRPGPTFDPRVRESVLPGWLPHFQPLLGVMRAFLE